MMQPLVVAVQTPLPRNPALERELFEDFESREAWQVYADWLQQQGDPYGKRIALEMQLEMADAKTRVILEAEIAKLEAAHRGSWWGRMVLFREVMQIDWEWGFVVAAVADNPEWLEALLGAPCGRFLRWLQLNHPRLERLKLETSGLPEPTVRAIGKCRAPNLQELQVWFGPTDSDEGANHMLEDLYAARGVPQLRRLGLMNAEFQDEIADSIAASKLLDQLTHLDLSRGTMTDAGAALILDNVDRFARLEHLDLSENFISPGMCKRLRSALPSVELREQNSLL